MLPPFSRQAGGAGNTGEEERRPEDGKRGRSGTRQKIVTQPREEGCDLGGAGSGARETNEGKERGDAGEWRCSGGAEFPDRDVTQVAGHQEPAIERRIDWEQSARTWCVDQTLHLI
jgi:hypothetical protein